MKNFQCAHFVFRANLIKKLHFLTLLLTRVPSRTNKLPTATFIIMFVAFVVTTFGIIIIIIIIIILTNFEIGANSFQNTCENMSNTI